MIDSWTQLEFGRVCIWAGTQHYPVATLHSRYVTLPFVGTLQPSLFVTVFWEVNTSLGTIIMINQLWYCDGTILYLLLSLNLYEQKLETLKLNVQKNTEWHPWRGLNGALCPHPWTTAAHCWAYWPPAGSVLSLTSSANGHYVPSSVPLLSKLQTVLDGGIALTTEKTKTPLSHPPSVQIHTRAVSHTFPIMTTDIRKTPVL